MFMSHFQIVILVLTDLGVVEMVVNGGGGWKKIEERKERGKIVYYTIKYKNKIQVTCHVIDTSYMTSYVYY